MIKNGFKLITVDGESACGKSTAGDILAAKFNYLHIDAGIIFRSLAYYLRSELKRSSELTFGEVECILKTKFVFRASKAFYNNRDITAILTTEEIGLLAYELGQQKIIQNHFIDFQRDLIQKLSLNKKGIIVSGRIGGSVVFPDADKKFFLTASSKAKTDRRLKQLQNKGFGGIRAASIAKTLKERDNIIKILPTKNLEVCARTNIIDTSQFTIERLPDILSSYF